MENNHGKGQHQTKDPDQNLSSNLLKQFHAESLPKEITDVLQLFFDCSIKPSIGENPSQIVDCPSTKSSSSSILNDQNELKDESVNESSNQTIIKSIVDITSDIPQNITSCTEFFDEQFRQTCCSRKCYTKFSKTIALKAHLDGLALDKYCPSHVNHQHLLLLGALNGLAKDHQNVVRKRKEKSEPNRSKAHTFFKFRGQDVCRKFFTYVYGCGDKRLRNVMKHFVSNGIDSTKHESVYNNSLNKLDSNRRCRDALIFIQNFAQQNALQLPGRYQKFQHVWCDLFLLPNHTNLSRRHIYEQYSSACSDLKTESISFALWDELWELYYPNIQTFSDRHERCFECRNYQKSITSHSNVSDDETSKLNIVQSYLNHLNLIQKELDNYRSIVDQCIKIYETYSKSTSFETNLKESFRSTLKSMHYTLSWFTTISLPQNEQNPKIYFKNGYKVALFGIACEPYRKFILYIIPEFICHNTNDLLNILISLLHHFFSIFRFGEQESFIHLSTNHNNQLKNELLLSYLIWRTIFGKHDKFQISSLPSAHSYCWNDLFFGVLKKTFRNCQIDSLDQLKFIAEHCCLDNHNDNHNNGNNQYISINNNLKDQPLQEQHVDNGRGGHIQTYLVGDDSNQILLPLYDWTSKLNLILKNFNSIKNFDEFNHFEIGIELPGHILCRKTIDDSLISSYRLISNENFTLIDENLPENILKIDQLSIERKTYLYDALIPFVKEKNNLKLFQQLSFNNDEIDSKIIIEDLDEGQQQQQQDGESSSNRSNKKQKSSHNNNNNNETSTTTYRKPKCSYCKQEGHRETMFGKIRCPKKKKDSLILTNQFQHEGFTKKSSIHVNSQKQATIMTDNTMDHYGQIMEPEETLSDRKTEELLAILGRHQESFQDDNDGNDHNEPNVDQDDNDDEDQFQKFYNHHQNSKRENG